MSSRPSSTERYRKAWAEFDRDDRRRVLRAVNRMQALEDPAEAALAVVFARRQRRLWTRWWWVVPVVSGLLALPGGYPAAVVNLAVSAVLFGGMAALFAWRAGRAARINQEVVDTARPKPRPGAPKKRNRSKKRSRGRSRK